MFQLSSCVRRAAWSCGLSVLIYGAGCGPAAVPDAASESVGDATSSSGSGGAGGAPNATSSSSSSGGGAGGAPVAAGLPIWSKAFDNAYPYSVAVDPSGNIVVAGYFRGSLDFGGGAPLKSAGGLDAFVLKLDPSGKALWGKSFGDASDEWARSVAVDGAGSVIITGNFQGVIDLGGGPLTAMGPSGLGFVAKLDASGNHLWSKAFGDGSGRDSFAAVDGSGDVLLTGGFRDAVDLGGGALQGSGIQPSIFLAKLDPGGHHLWSEAFGDRVEVRSIAVDGQGEAAITGMFYGPIDFGGGQLPSANFNNAYLAQFDATGGHLWSKGFGLLHDSEGTCVGVGKSGALFVTGHFTDEIDFGAGTLMGSPGNEDIFAAKFDVTGAFWGKRFGDIADDIPYGCAASAAGDVILTGAFGVTKDPQKPGGSIDFGGGPLMDKGDADIFVAKLDPLGDHRWSRGAGDVDTQYGTSVAVDTAASTIVAGYFKGTINLGGTALSCPEGMFLAKFGP